jgi:hypothetical protein
VPFTERATHEFVHPRLHTPQLLRVVMFVGLPPQQRDVDERT